MSQRQEQKPKAQRPVHSAMQGKFQQAVALHQQGRLADAENIYKELLKQQPNHFAALHLLGIIALQTQQTQRAAELIQHAIRLNANVAAAHCNLAKALLDLKCPQEALASCEKALALRPDFAEAHNNCAVALTDLGRHEQALSSCEKAIALKPDYAEAHNNRGIALNNLARHEQALESCDRAIALNPDYAEAYSTRGIALNDLKRHELALASFDNAIALSPQLVETHFNRGIALNNLKRYELAVASYDKAIALRPNLAEAHYNRGIALNNLKRHELALASCDKAIVLRPDLVEAHYNRGIALNNLKRNELALASYDKAIALRPHFLEAHCNRADTLRALKRYQEAAAAYAQVLNADPQHPLTKGKLLHLKMLSCDWDGIVELIEEIDEDVAGGRLSAEPFGWQGVAKSQRSLQLCNELYNKRAFPPVDNIAMREPLPNHNKIRIGYSSGELREQATASLIVGVLELHDHSKFEIYCIDNGWDDKSAIRKRINASAHRIIDISRLNDSLAAAAIHDNQIDILINLNGYFGEHRTGVFALKPAPIQVNYLGFPGTLGASYIDYIIADQYVVPSNHIQFYTEKIVYLPDCYQANDRNREIAIYRFTRSECGLPQTGFVFCCFNNNYKITPEVFDSWIRILKQVESSVLWLLQDNASAAFNLRAEAVSRGVNAERLVFAPRMALPYHLARHHLADLFLDTLPCNAHTTASDALWAGLPVLTQIGDTFSARVAASLLHAIGLPELITYSPQAYEQFAIELATTPQKLAAIKRKLADNRLSTPLFDTQLFTRNIEAAYTEMYKRNRTGRPPDHIFVQPKR